MTSSHCSGHHRSVSQHSIDRFSLQRSTDDDISGAESDSSSFLDDVRRRHYSIVPTLTRASRHFPTCTAKKPPKKKREVGVGGEFFSPLTPPLFTIYLHLCCSLLFSLLIALFQKNQEAEEKNETSVLRYALSVFIPKGNICLLNPSAPSFFLFPLKKGRFVSFAGKVWRLGQVDKLLSWVAEQVCSFGRGHLILLQDERGG